MIDGDYIDVITESYRRQNHFITKEVGEGYVSGMIAAIANAVANAVGEHTKKLPVTLPVEIEKAAEDEGK